MTYENFKQELLTALSEITSEKLQFTIQSIPKNNGIVLDGLLITSETSNITPTIYLHSYFSSFQSGASIKEIAKNILDFYYEHRPLQSVDNAFFNDFSEIKDNIIFKLINAGQNEALLKKVPFLPFLDFAIVFCYYLDASKCSFLSPDLSGSILIEYEHMEQWQIDARGLFALAQKNTPSLLPLRFAPLCELLFQESEKSADVPDTPLYVLTNEKQYFGAAALLYPHILDMCAETLGQSFYMIPSSIHEVLLLPADACASSCELNRYINDVNAEAVMPNEVLSNHSYYFNSEKREFQY